MSNADVTQQDVESFERDGALCQRGAFAPRWIEGSTSLATSSCSPESGTNFRVIE